MNITTLTTCDQDTFNDFIVIDESSINSNEFVTCGRLLLKSTSNNQNKRKDSTTSQSKSKIRYRLSSKYDFKNLKFGTEGSCQNNNDEEESAIIQDENDTNERIVELIDTQENLKEFEEVKTVQHSVHNDTELDKTAFLEFCAKLQKLWLLGLLVIMLLLFFSSSFHMEDDLCSNKNRSVPISCALDGYIELSKMG